MPRSSVEIDPAVLRRLYVEQRLVAAEIARRLGCAPITVLRRLRRFQIPVRPVGPTPRRSEHPPTWSAKLAYAVGLITTDGNLSLDGRHLAIPSIDRDLLESLRDCLGLHTRIVPHKNHGGFIYRLQWRDRVLYDWLLSIGLRPAKSLTLGTLKIPEAYFADFFRGCIDGDGSIVCTATVITPPNASATSTSGSMSPSSPRAPRSSRGCSARCRRSSASPERSM